MNSLYINLLASLIWFLAGLLFVKYKRLYSSTYPARKLWQFKDPNNFIICIANSTITDTGDYHRPATGIGQVRAVATLTMSLKKAYSGTHIDHIFMSTDQLHNRIENDIIILGGIKNNIIAKHYLEIIKDVQPANMDTNSISWKNDDNTVEKFKGITDGKEVLYDYGLIMRTYNPFLKDNTAVFIAGCHTYGTVAASNFFTKEVIKMERFLSGKYIVIIISCKIVNCQPVNVEILKEYIWS